MQFIHFFKMNNPLNMSSDTEADFMHFTFSKNGIFRWKVKNDTHYSHKNLRLLVYFIFQSSSCHLRTTGNSQKRQSKRAIFNWRRAFLESFDYLGFFF